MNSCEADRVPWPTGLYRHRLQQSAQPVHGPGIHSYCDAVLAVHLTLFVWGFYQRVDELCCFIELRSHDICESGFVHSVYPVEFYISGGAEPILP